MSNRVAKSEITTGIILNSTEVTTYAGEVMVLSAPTGTMVRVEAFGWDGQPYTKMVKASSLRWQ